MERICHHCETECVVHVELSKLSRLLFVQEEIRFGVILGQSYGKKVLPEKLKHMKALKTFEKHFL